MTTIERAAGSTLDAVQSVAPVVREHADLSERQGKLADPVVAAMKAEGLFKGLAPRSLGGRETHPVDWLKTVEAAARIDGSFGWSVFINGSSGLTGRSMAAEYAERLIPDPDFVVAGAVFPFGKAQVTDGGFIANGRWTYASGIPHASHAFGFAIVHDGDVPRFLAPGIPAMVTLLTEQRNVQILDTWDVSGLCATASNDFVMQDVFIPEATALGLIAQPNHHYQSPVYRLPFMALFGWPMGAVALGIAQHAIDELLEMSATKVPAGGAGAPRLAERPVFHLHLSEAIAAVESARAWFHACMAECLAVAEAGQTADLSLRNRTQLAASNATRSASRAVELMYLAGGGTANFRKSPLQRCMRDMHALTQHVGTNPTSWELAGAIAAGLPPTNPLLLL